MSLIVAYIHRDISWFTIQLFIQNPYFKFILSILHNDFLLFLFAIHTWNILMTNFQLTGQKRKLAYIIIIFCGIPISYNEKFNMQPSLVILVSICTRFCTVVGIYMFVIFVSKYKFNLITRNSGVHINSEIWYMHFECVSCLLIARKKTRNN